MTKEQEFYNRVEDEYDDFFQEVEEYDTEEVLNEAQRIAKMQSIYEYLTEFRPIGEDRYPELMDCENPLGEICDRYNPSAEEYHEELCVIIEDLIRDIKKKQEKAVAPRPQSVCDLVLEIHKERERYENKLAPRIDRNAWDNVVKNVFGGDFHFDEYDAKVLLQFKEPLFVLVKEIGSTTENFPSQIERVIENLESVDLLTYQHELNKDRILPETFQRHDAIIELMDIVPDFHFQTAMRWLGLNRAINECMLDSDGEDNPYQDFMRTMHDIKSEHGDELLQKVFDVGADIVVQPEELVEVAKYLADGGEPDRISELVEDDYFLIPYEKQKQGGMDLC